MRAQCRAVCVPCTGCVRTLPPRAAAHVRGGAISLGYSGVKISLIAATVCDWCLLVGAGGAGGLQHRGVEALVCGRYDLDVLRGDLRAVLIVGLKAVWVWAGASSGVGVRREAAHTVL